MILKKCTLGLLICLSLLQVRCEGQGLEGLEATLARCCNLGIVLSWDNKTCTEHSGPVTGVPPEHQAPCLSTIDACCRKSYREKQCHLGHDTAKSGKECMPGFGQGANYHKDCCEGCKLGLVAGAMGLYCEFQSLRLALGPPWDSSLTKCCLEAGGKAGYPNTGPPTRPSTRPAATQMAEGGLHGYHPTPRTINETRDVCALFPGQLCAHNCVTEGNSYLCTCQEGFRLLPDGKSCHQDKLTSGKTGNSGRSSGTHTTPRPSNYYSSYTTSSSYLATHNQIIPIQCPLGFTLNSDTQVCDDIDECLTGQQRCYPYKTCRNTLGSYTCESVDREGERDYKCPPGYRQNSETGQCVDIDECAEGYDICVREIQYCINTPGGFDCQSKKDFNRYNCPAGYKFNNLTLNCEDVNECAEKLDSCDTNSETCRNTAGAYECDIQCRDGFRYDIRLRTCQDVNECSEGTHDCRIEVESCVNVQGSYQCHQLDKNQDNDCPPGYEPNKNYTFLCKDRDECLTGLHTCAEFETCVNEIGGYRCEVNADTDFSSTTPSLDDEEPEIEDNNIPDSGISTRSGGSTGYDYGYSRDTTSPAYGASERQDKNLAFQSATTTTTARPSTECPPGHRASYRSSYPSRGEQPACEDIDECAESSPCDSSQTCQNTVGSFYCRCKTGFYRDPITRSCQDINECQTGQHQCLSSQRCDNSPGSYSCIRITGCGTGYTLNSQTGQCEDDDECLFGNHDCHRLGPEWQCKNTLGSFRCERVIRQCPTGLSLAPNGECRSTCPSGFQFNSRGECVDVDECNQSPLIGGRSMCSTSQRCVNSQGSYQCISKTICPAGFEPDEAGTRCIDVDECARATHSCKPNQQCLNRGGGYICQCPSGHTVTPEGDCEDVNECEKYGAHVCGGNADCYNTVGSFRCICKDGFELEGDNRTCADINECEVITGLCEQNCINLWGSYQCTCGMGYVIGDDGRSCQDVNECEQNKEGTLCLGRCVNTHGSYRCECPDGYSLAPDTRTCRDIDECNGGNVCRTDEFCLNTRGGFRCNRIVCPPGYSIDGEHIHRCKKTSPSNTKEPLTISKSFISFESEIRIPQTGYIDLFTMRGPQWTGSVKHFSLELKSARAPSDVPSSTRGYFLLRRPTSSSAVVALAKPIVGPQDVELELKMDVYHRGQYAGSAVAQILIVVTKADF
ncbi:unnamed protein product [Orchesella dallaii]|uniref:EGF-like domain-containing protein n=1 Tax=Orchesella dallaii TaxID=48710 RepID=A0ABP1RSU2_9HEXA